MQKTPAAAAAAPIWRASPGIEPDRLLDEHVLAGLDGEQGVRQVQVVRGRDVDDVDLGVGDERRVGGVRPGGPEGVRGSSRSLGAA